MLIVCVDIPKANGKWQEVTAFLGEDAKTEALAFVKGRYGTDDEGRVSLLSVFNTEEEVHDGT